MAQDIIALIIIACSVLFLIRLIYIRFKGIGNGCCCNDCPQGNSTGKTCADCNISASNKHRKEKCDKCRM